MKKQLNNSVIPAQAGIQETAEALLESITRTQGIMTMKMGAYNAAITLITDKYEKEISGYNAALDADEKSLLSLMKKNKVVLFEGTDVVNLQHGSLIREKGNKISIPKTALAICQKSYRDVIKVVESLDRDAIEKWPDSKLLLIGAERKKKEEFKYSLKK
jgi:hypothetical protein